MKILKNLLYIILTICGGFLSLLKFIKNKIKGRFYDSIDLERYIKTVKLVKKYIRKLIYPTIIVSLFLSAIYVSIWNYYFHSIQSIVFLFIFILIFVVFVIRGCLRGEDYQDEITGNN